MLELKNVSFSYKKKKVLDNLSLTLKKGEILAVMGPSGCGKTTLLSLIAGLLKPTDGELLSNASRISYAFQEPRLFPWLTVEENLRAVLQEEKSADEIASLLHSLGLGGCEKLYPKQLSGGMKARVSLARACVFDGDLFLLDEPFSALDEELRCSVIDTVAARLRERGASALLVTHQASDAERIADRILYLKPIQVPTID
jgi:NitT/TauT family transport system ATP-binding protein